jgi:transposase
MGVPPKESPQVIPLKNPSKEIPFKEPSKDFYRESAELKYIFDYLPENHPVFVYVDIFEKLSTSQIQAKYSPIGQHAYHPQMLMGLLVYSYCHGVFSSREIASRCRTDLGFMYISWMLQPDHRTISDFRKDNLEEFKVFFKETVLLAKEMGMVNLGHVSLDGSKFKANTSKHKAMSYAYMQKKEQELMHEIEELLKKANGVDEAEDSFLGGLSGEEIAEELKIKEQRLKKIQEAKKALEDRESSENPGKEIDGKKQISFADKEARIMGKNGNFEYAYNGQITVESSNQIIIGEHLSQAANDKKEVDPALKEIEDTLGEQPEKMSLDNGYFSADNIENLENAGIDGYIAVGREGRTKEEIAQSNRKITKEDFVYEEQTDQYLCPEGKSLELKSSGQDGSKVYQAKASDCLKCPLRDRCTTSEQGRSLSVDGGEPARKRMKDKMEDPQAKEVYSKRKTIVEPVFGVIKCVMGFVDFSVRGIEKASGEFSLVCGAYNIKKIVNAILKGDVYPDSEIQGEKVVGLGENWKNFAYFFVFLLLRFIRESYVTLLARLRLRFVMYSVSYPHS